MLQLSSKVGNKFPKVKKLKIKEKISITQNADSLTLKKKEKIEIERDGGRGEKKERKSENSSAIWCPCYKPIEHPRILLLLRSQDMLETYFCSDPQNI